MADTQWPGLFASYEDDNYGYCKNIEDCCELVQLFSYETSTSYVVTRTTKKFGEYNLSGIVLDMVHNWVTS